ncbi:hypothetical protein CHL67_11545 [Prosthecochloris sp. GSB1]|uniref:hypothetical protein n=1 Tax=Prosthecochloris sp. GSB1 TaxID=281093 RepID=UPI000B8C88D0|nr:hypothetical protein [Prosthecochloris sp. GSB1]ASQ91472.1 hypothetical protein CHL67_11545 [Prosthecochloris sp. GSB1]
MDVKSFQLNGFQIDIRAEILSSRIMRATVFIYDSRVDNVVLDVHEDELEQTVDRLEQMLREKLEF